MKKHFIFLGRVGIIYFSWVFVIFFISLIFNYENTKEITWPTILFGLLFLVIMIYTWFESYYDSQVLKLPYQSKIKINMRPNIIWKWKILIIEKIAVNKVQQYYLFRINITEKE